MDLFKQSKKNKNSWNRPKLPVGDTKITQIKNKSKLSLYLRHYAKVCQGITVDKVVAYVGLSQ